MLDPYMKNRQILDCASENRKLQSLVQHSSIFERLLQPAQIGRRRPDRFGDCSIRRHIHIVFGKVDPGFQVRNDVNQIFLYRTDTL